ncbi:MAG: hypothetical protein M4579_001728 [Chaenotheca gracillima]|nr:MAG: hypothetical protein M4579_001728 [Chaenotheca gracillima]
MWLTGTVPGASFISPAANSASQFNFIASDCIEIAMVLRPAARHRASIADLVQCRRTRAGKGFARCTRQFSQSRPSTPIPQFAFAFDIDGVLLRSSKPIPGAQKALSHLQKYKIPFIFLTNGGGKHESDRVAELSEKLQISLDPSMFVQSHTPFANMVDGRGLGGLRLRDKCVLVVGGEGNKCRDVAERYGFQNVVTPGDIFAASPSIWPFSNVFSSYYESFAKPLPRPIDPKDPSRSLKIDAIMVFNDPRDWALDTQVILDLLMSSNGVLGTMSSKNNNPELPNRGFQGDGQPALYFSNPDLWWAAEYPLPRLGQGGFREAFEGVWAAATGGPTQGVELKKTIIGKPYQGTYEFAEHMLNSHRTAIFPGGDAGKLSEVFMVGDNPHSDIQGANDYKSPWGSSWTSMLVRTGIYTGGKPSVQPKLIVDDVWDAVRAGLMKAGWDVPT